MNRPRGSGGLSVDGEVEGEIRTERVEQSGVPRHRVEYADREEEHARGERELRLRALSDAQQEQAEQGQRQGRVLYPDRRGQHREESHRPDHPRPVRRWPYAQGQQHRQQGRGDELGHRLVGKADQLVPERAGYQRDPRRGLVQVPPRKKVHSGGNQQGNRAERQLDPADVPHRMTETGGVQQRDHPGGQTGHQPRTHAVEDLPVDDAVAEDCIVRRLQVLHDLVGVQYEVAGEGDGRTHCERRHEHRPQELPDRCIGRLRVQQDPRRGVQRRTKARPAALARLPERDRRTAMPSRPAPVACLPGFSARPAHTCLLESTIPVLDESGTRSPQGSPSRRRRTSTPRLPVSSGVKAWTFSSGHCVG